MQILAEHEKRLFSEQISIGTWLIERNQIGPEPNRNLTEWTDKRNRIMEPVNHSMYI